MALRARFDSSHVCGAYPNGRLIVETVWPDARRGLTRHDTLRFSVPPGFHAHNDAVAAALMTLIGPTCPEVEFNFPISRHCADLLSAHYGLTEIDPVDDSLAPRAPGRWLALNYSGGCDSTALWCLLTYGLGLEFKVVTNDYGGRFVHERAGYSVLPRDITCATNFRELGYDEQGRFNAAAALLHADVLDLGVLASGHTARQLPDDVADFNAGVARPRFVRLGDAYAAGGLTEAHLCRGLNTLGMLRILLATRPDLLETAVRGSAPLRAEKALSKAYMLKWLMREQGLPEPDWLRGLDNLPERHMPDTPPRPTGRSLFITKHFGIDIANRILPGLALHDLTFLDDVRYTYLGRYDPRYDAYMPPELRAPLLAAYARFGLLPYDERDWHEHELIGRITERQPVTDSAN